MADPERRRAPAEHPSHDDHDLLLVAAVAAGDAEAGDAEAGDAEAGDRGPADDLLAACPACAVVAKDLRAIQAATAAVPAPARGRDFRLTLADAERLRPRGWRGLLSGLARPRPERAYPVAAGLTMLGLTGLLVSAISFGVGGGAGTAAAPGGAERDINVQLEWAAPGGGEPAGPDVDVTGLGAAASPDVPRDDAKRLAERPTEVAGGPSRLAIGLLSAGAMLGGLLLLMRARRQRRQFR